MDRKEMLIMIGERIMVTRKRAKLSQTELGRLVGYSINGIAKIERGESDPKFSTVMKIAEALKVPLLTLVSPSEPSNLTRVEAAVRTVMEATMSDSPGLAEAIAKESKKKLVAKP